MKSVIEIEIDKELLDLVRRVCGQAGIDVKEFIRETLAERLKQLEEFVERIKALREV